MGKKLYIYDKTSGIDRDQADGRFDAGEVVQLGIDSVKMLKLELNQLAANHKTFDRLLVQTHGSPGNVYFHHEPLNATTLLGTFLGKGYDALFPKHTRIYFDGCNVAEGLAGTVFFNAVGQTFLPKGGGEVFGFTSVGHGVPGWVPLVGGHTVHFTGRQKKLFFKPGGVVRAPTPEEEFKTLMNW